MSEGPLIPTNSWGGLNLRAPDFLEETRESVANFFEVLIAILEIVLVVLSVVKVFLVGLINPLIPLLETIITFVEGLLVDIQSVGAYIHGDYVFLDDGLETFTDSVAGGYPGYEQRMVARLLDRNDPNRPDISASSYVISAFFYTSVGTGSLLKLVKFVQALMKLFGKDIDSSLPTPAKPQIAYGYSASPLGVAKQLSAEDAFNSVNGGVPDIATARWDMIPQGNPVVISPLYPTRFLVEISTLPQGVLVNYARPILSNTGTSDSKIEYEVGSYYDPITKSPLRIFGGSDRINIPRSGAWNDGFNEDGIKNGAELLYGIRSPKESDVIPLELLTYEGKKLLGTSHISKNLSVQSPSIDLVEEMLPFEAEFEKNGDGTYRVVPESVQRARNVYVRVTTCSDNVETVGDVKFNLDPVLEKQPSFKVGQEIEIGRPSQVERITFPSGDAAVFIKSLQTALAILLLSRADINTDPDLSPIAAKSNPKVSEIFSNYFSDFSVTSKEPEDCFSFRSRTLGKVRTTSTLMFEAMGNLSTPIYDIVSATQEDLLDKKITSKGFPASQLNKTVLELLNDTSLITGLSKNNNSVGTLNETASKVVDGAQTQNNLLDETAPILVVTNDDLVSFDPDRNPFDARSEAAVEIEFFFTRLEPETIAAAAKVLSLVPARSVTGDWIALRLFPEGIPGVEDFLTTIIKTLKAIKESLKGVIKAIEDYIAFFEIRILQFQQVLRQIEVAILNLLQVLDLIPSGLVLFTVSSGTDGVVNDLLLAENKPNDPPADFHSAGVILVGGGVPTLVADLLLLMLKGGD